MKWFASTLIISLLLLSCAHAESLRQQVNAPEHIALESFGTATGLTSFTLDAVVEVPDVDAVNTYVYIPQMIADETVLDFAKAIGITDLNKLKYDDYQWGSNLSTSFIYHKNGHFLSVSNILYDNVCPSSSLNYTQLNAKYDYDAWLSFTELMGECAPDTKYPYADAKTLALQVAAAIAPGLELGLSGITFGYQQLTDAQIKQLNDPDYKGTRPTPRVYGGYMFKFYQVVDGVPVTITDDQAAGGGEEYTYPIFAERLNIVVADGKVASVAFNSVTGKIGEVKQANCPLLDFETVLGIATKILPLKFASGEVDTTTSIIYNIDRITLGYMRVAVKDHPHEYELVPVWDLFGTYVYKGIDQKGKLYEVEWATMDRSFLTINAIDGTIIDRHYGY